jgi:hypothetical protein
MKTLLRVLVVTALSLIASHASAQDEPLWEKLRAGGHVVLMRHAQTTPGGPSGFRILGRLEPEAVLADPPGRERRRVLPQYL